MAVDQLIFVVIVVAVGAIPAGVVGFVDIAIRLRAFEELNRSPDWRGSVVRTHESRVISRASHALRNSTSMKSVQAWGVMPFSAAERKMC